MKAILTLSKREITRLRTRFSGKSRLIVLALVAIMIAGSYALYHQELVVSKGLYTVGVAPGGPAIEDQRFAVMSLDHETGYELLSEKKIDLYLDGERIILRDDERSRYAAAALRQHLAKGELLRVAGQYELDQAFPLRVEVQHLEMPETGSEEGTGTILTAIPEAGERGNPDALISEPAYGPGGIISEEPVPPGEQSTSGALAPQPSPGPVTPGADEPAPASPPESDMMPGVAVSPSPPSVPPASASDDMVRKQLTDFMSSRQLPEFKAEFVVENDVIIPSLMNPPIPLAQVMITFFYVVPVFFVSLFFTSSFTEEKVNRKLIVLLSAPVTRLQVILGKMLPYLGYSVLVIIAVTLALGGNVGLGLAIFLPVMLFIFSVYLMVALTYRTFKDQTFFSVLALSVITVYLVGPAMFAGVSELSYISPLTLAVEMYRGESFGLTQYFLATTPLYLVFLQTMFIGTRIFNEEYLMGFRPLPTKVGEALYMTMDRNHLNISVLLISMCLVPVVFMVQLASVAFVANLPMRFTIVFLMVISVIIEEIAKSMGIVVLLRNHVTTTLRGLVVLSFLSALGFLIGEKLLMYLALSVISESVFISALFGSGLLAVPLILHFVSTAVVCLLTGRFGTRFYPLAIGAGAVIHTLYNLIIIGAVL